jgi:hypothetical protein
MIRISLNQNLVNVLLLWPCGQLFSPVRTAAIADQVPVHDSYVIKDLVSNGIEDKKSMVATKL